MGDLNNTTSVTRLPGQPGKATPAGTASIGVSLGGTLVAISVQTPDGGVINDVEVELVNLRKNGTGANSNKISWRIDNAQYDERVATNSNRLDVRARKVHYGPLPPTGGAFTPGEFSGFFDFTKGTPLSVTAVLQEGALSRYTDTYDSIPARALTPRQARDALLCLHGQGRIRLVPEPVFNHTGDVCNAANCKLAHPLVGELVGMKPKVGDVDCLYIGIPPQTNDRWAASAAAGDLLQLDVRNAVGLYRLCQLLTSDYQVSTLYHSGISGGQGRVDCHGQGRAIDFDGVASSSDTVTVYNDWSKQPVFDLTDPQTDPAQKRRSTTTVWPYVARDLMYRLNPVPPGGRDIAGRLFQDVYNFAVEQYQDKTTTPTQTDPASTIGQGGFVMNADHHATDAGGPHGREAHNTHIHMQIGSTGTDPTPAVEPEP